MTEATVTTNDNLKNNHSLLIAEELRKAKEMAQAPDTKWLSHNEVWENLRKKYDF